MTQTERRRFLLSRLLSEAPEYRHLAVPDDAAGQKQLLRALLNVRPPRDASPEFLQVQDEYLRAELVPHCPHCGKLLTMNLRCDDSFVEDAGWHAAAERYSEFLRRRGAEDLVLRTWRRRQHPGHHQVSFLADDSQEPQCHPRLHQQGRGRLPE